MGRHALRDLIIHSDKAIEECQTLARDLAAKVAELTRLRNELRALVPALPAGDEPGSL